MTIGEAEDAAEFGAGHNQPPPDEDPLAKINPEKLVDCDVTAVLYAYYGALVERKAALLKNIEGWVEDHTPPVKRGEKPLPPVVGDEQDLRDTTDHLNQIKDFIKKEVEATRKKVTGPIDSAKQDIQKFFVKGMIDKLEEAIRPVRDAQSVALREKEERERKRLRDEAWEKAQAANRLAIQAARATGVVAKESLLEQAFKIEDEAAALEQAAEASVTEITRTRTDLGGVTGLRSNWKFEVVNLIELLMEIVAGRQPIEWVTLNEVYANSKIKTKDGVRSIPGLHIHEEKTAR